MSKRLDDMRDFLIGTSWAEIEPVFLAGDASARQYYRLNDHTTAIVMDAPTKDNPSTPQYMAVTRHLRDAGLSAPTIFKQDLENGFLLLEDFGDGVFARLIENDPKLETPLYRAALDVALRLELVEAQPGLPAPNAHRLATMVEPAFTWYRWAILGDVGHSAHIIQHLGKALNTIPSSAMSLRDFHAENLIWLPDRYGVERVGLLDFQDAFWAPKGYDLVSLLYDARKDVADDTIKTIQADYARATGIDIQIVEEAFAILSLQRNLRILGVFVRLALKLNKPRYLDFLPRVWRYVDNSAAHPHLADLGSAVLAELPPPTEAILEELRQKCGTCPDRL